MACGSELPALSSALLGYENGGGRVRDKRVPLSHPAVVVTHLLVVVAPLAGAAIHALSRAGTPRLALLRGKYECALGSPLTKPVPPASPLRNPTPGPVTLDLRIEPLGPDTH